MNTGFNEGAGGVRGAGGREGRIWEAAYVRTNPTYSDGKGRVCDMWF